jgi:8-oxo-dGTP diphosphatase
MTHQTVTADGRHLTASAVVVNHHGQVLLVDHRAYQSWVFPGGHVEPDEAPDETAAREVWEETGIRIRIVNPPTDSPTHIGTHPAPWMTTEQLAPAKPAGAEPAHRHIDLLYLAVAAPGQPLGHDDPGVAAARWVDLADLAALPVRADVPALAVAAVDYLRHHH